MKATEFAIISISKAVEFIEHNLKEEITIADIAEAACYSLYHFCRMFNTLTHHTPYDYLMRRRLSESARELVETDRKIIEIAFDYQFNSHEVFTRAFKRMFGMQPNQWKKQGKLPQWLLMPKLTSAYLTHINQGDYLRPVLEEKAAFQVAGLMTLVKDDPIVFRQLWDILAQTLEGITQTVPALKYYGITWYPPAWEERGFLYMIAIELITANMGNPAFVIKTIPALKYAKFIHKGLWQNLSLTFAYIYHTWLPQSGKSLADPFEIVCYGQGLPEIEQEESEWEIYLPII
jgi:AraC family transcriptional regulator